MITNQLKSDIDRLWLEFHTGGITNPLTVIEQISFLMFARLLDIEETRFEKMAGRTGKSPHKNFSPDQQNLRWKNWSEYGGEEMLRHVRDQVFGNNFSSRASSILDSSTRILRRPLAI